MMPLAVAEEHGVRRHHFGVKPRALRQQPVQHAAMPVGAVHHGRDGKTVACCAHRHHVLIPGSPFDKLRVRLLIEALMPSPAKHKDWRKP